MLGCSSLSKDVYTLEDSHRSQDKIIQQISKDLSEAKYLNKLGKNGLILVVGEEHNSSVQARFQLSLITKLKSEGFRVSLAWEFFPKNIQGEVSEWYRGQITDIQLLQAMGYPKASLLLDFYKPQLKAIDLGSGAKVLAINAPKSLAKKLSKGGMESLLPHEKAQIPMGFGYADELYQERFAEAMNQQVDSSHGETADKMYLAQALWDDTMATESLNGFREISGGNDILVIIVGDFHSSFNGGLVQRLNVRAPEMAIKTISFYQPSKESSYDVENPHPKYGPRADYIWTLPSQVELK